MRVCVCVSVSVHVHILGTTHPNFIKFSAHSACGRGLVFLCNTLHISGFVDDKRPL